MVRGDVPEGVCGEGGEGGGEGEGGGGDTPPDNNGLTRKRGGKRNGGNIRTFNAEKRVIGKRIALSGKRLVARFKQRDRRENVTSCVLWTGKCWRACQRHIRTW